MSKVPESQDPRNCNEGPSAHEIELELLGGDDYMRAEEAKELVTRAVLELGEVVEGNERARPFLRETLGRLRVLLRPERTLNDIGHVLKRDDMDEERTADWLFGKLGHPPAPCPDCDAELKALHEVIPETLSALQRKVELCDCGNPRLVWKLRALRLLRERDRRDRLEEEIK